MWPFTVWMNCSSDLKDFVNSWPSAPNLNSFYRSLLFFLTVGQNNFGNKIPFSSKAFNFKQVMNSSNFFFVARKLFKPCRWQIFLGPHFFCNLLRVIKTLNFAPWKKPHDTHFENCHSNCHSILDYNHLIQEMMPQWIKLGTPFGNSRGKLKIVSVGKTKTFIVFFMLSKSLDCS